MSCVFKCLSDFLKLFVSFFLNLYSVSQKVILPKLFAIFSLSLSILS